MFGLSPFDEIKKGALNMATNWACHIALVQADNQDTENANNKSANEAEILGDFLEELKEQSTSRGN